MLGTRDRTMEIVALKRILFHYIVLVITLAAAYAIMEAGSAVASHHKVYPTVLWLPSGIALIGVLMGGAQVCRASGSGRFYRDVTVATGDASDVRRDPYHYRRGSCRASLSGGPRYTAA